MAATTQEKKVFKALQVEEERQKDDGDMVVFPVIKAAVHCIVNIDLQPDSVDPAMTEMEKRLVLLAHDLIEYTWLDCPDVIKTWIKETVDAIRKK